MPPNQVLLLYSTFKLTYGKMQKRLPIRSYPSLFLEIASQKNHTGEQSDYLEKRDVHSNALGLNWIVEFKG